MWTVQSWYDEARAGAAKNPDWYKQMARFKVPVYLGGLPGETEAGLARRLQESNRRRLDAQPSVTLYPELRGMRALVEAQWRGIRDGAGLSDLEHAITCDGYFYFHRYIQAGRVPPKARCSAVYFPTSDRGPLLGVNLDTGPGEPFGPPSWPVGEHLVVGGVSSGVFRDEESPEIFPAPVLTLMQRYCRSTDEAVALLTRYNHFWGPGNLLVVDREHQVAMIEKTSCRIAVRRTRGFGFVTAMVQVDPQLKAYVAQGRLASLKDRNLDPNDCDDVVYWRAQDQRQRLMEELMEEARRQPTVAALQRIMQFRDPKRGNVAGDGEKVRPHAPDSGVYEHTLATYVTELSRGVGHWWARDNQRGIPSWKNPQPDVRFDNVWLWTESAPA